MNNLQYLMQNPEDISNPTTALDMALKLMANAFQLNNFTPTNNNQISSSNPCNSQIAQSRHLVGQNAVLNKGIRNVGNQNALSVVPRIANQHGNGNDNLQQASTSSTQSDKALVYDLDGSTKGIAHGTSTNTMLAKQSILGKPPSSSRPKLYAVTPLPKSNAIPKIDESHVLSKPITSNSIPTLTESKVVKNDNVISPGIFRMNPCKASRGEYNNMIHSACTPVLPRIRLSWSKMSFHQELDLIFKLDETTVECTRDILRQIDCLDRFSEIPWVVSTFVVIEGEDIIAEFYGPFRWKELSKETSSKILPCGDGSCWKTFKPIASLIANGQLK
uniref:Uncharacterized protein n=1 Tax=Tanacetum cinerariifolium TaxID=118510 RepID=A0A6L2NN23_TANCI|nr:hypothetical protein [Tanacetum cinerariifolium]GEV58002.1 hypothetical protein [Tanacetum cinerariifolium]